MTKREAVELEALCEKHLKRALGVDAAVSMNLCGKLKIIFEDGDYISITKDFISIDYVNYHGFFETLTDYIHKILKCIQEHEDDFLNLIWSYEHINELEG